MRRYSYDREAMVQDENGDFYDVADVDDHVEVRDRRIAKLEQELKDLAWRVVANAGRLSEERKPRWSHVSDATGHGSTASRDLCVSAGFDPDVYQGGDE